VEISVQVLGRGRSIQQKLHGEELNTYISEEICYSFWGSDALIPPPNNFLSFHSHPLQLVPALDGCIRRDIWLGHQAQLSASPRTSLGNCDVDLQPGLFFPPGTHAEFSLQGGLLKVSFSSMASSAFCCLSLTLCSSLHKTRLKA
jgi:hypothetical protein